MLLLLKMMLRPTDDRPRPPHDGSALAGIVHRNIQALVDLRQRQESRRSPTDTVAAAITRFAGSMWFVYLHALVYGLWIAVNVGWVPGIRRFDPEFVRLAMAASVEAIFLSTFILINQNRMAKVADQRADLDLQVSLLAEHEVTRLIQMVDAIGRKLDVPQPHADVEELKQDVAPEAVAREIAKAEQTLEARTAKT